MACMRVEDLRAAEYAHLTAAGGVYLDYTGAGAVAASQLRAHVERLSGAGYGNPHSDTPASAASTALVESARRRVLAFLNADPAEYAVIWTANATGAVRLVGEAFDGPLLLTADNHNSVNGLREYARPGFSVIPLGADLRIDTASVVSALGATEPGLFAYPAQSNFSGVRHPLDWIAAAQSAGWLVLLDAAAFVPSHPLDLSAVRPDFVPISWYKVFGYPTGVGSLVVRRSALRRLKRPWFSGGTIRVVSVAGDWHVLMDDETAFEDGTPNFLSIPDVEVGIDWISSIGIAEIGAHALDLTLSLLDGLTAMKHANGNPLVRVYGPVDGRDRGPTVAFNFLDPDGVVVDERIVAAAAAAHGFSLRTGCFCNPGAAEAALRLSPSLLRDRRMPSLSTFDDYVDFLGAPSGGAVRVSLGVASHADDVERFLGFAAGTFCDAPQDRSGLTPRVRC
jgi:selenocysteine lyase/cysteine desulfurase